MIFSLFWEGAFIRRQGAFIRRQGAFIRRQGAFIRREGVYSRGSVYFKITDFRGPFIRGNTVFQSEVDKWNLTHDPLPPMDDAR